MVMADYHQHGIELSFDYEHAAMFDGSETPKGAPSAGWFAPEIRNGELWATNIRFTPRAADYLKNREYRYFSPAFKVDEETNRITCLINCALTNIPATDNLTPIVAAKGSKMAKIETVTTKDGMSLEDHANCMKDNLAECKDMHGEAKEMHKEHMKAVKELSGHMSKMVENKAKTDDDADASEDDEDEETKMKNDVEKAKGLIDSIVGIRLTPSEAKDLKSKLDTGVMTSSYVEGYLSAPKLSLVAGSETIVAQPPVKTSVILFKDEQFAKSMTTRINAKHEIGSGKIETAADAEAYLAKVCRTSGIDLEKVKADWVKNVERYEALREDGRLREISVASKINLNVAF